MTTWVNTPDPLIHPWGGVTISLKPRSHVPDQPQPQPPPACRSSVNTLDVLLMTRRMFSWGTCLLQQHVTSQRRSIGFTASMSPSSRPCWPPPAAGGWAGGWALLWNGHLRCCPSSWLVSWVFLSTAFVGEQGCLQQLKQNKRPARSFLMRVHKCCFWSVRTPRKLVQLGSLQFETRF